MSTQTLTHNMRIKQKLDWNGTVKMIDEIMKKSNIKEYPACKVLFQNYQPQSKGGRAFSTPRSLSGSLSALRISRGFRIQTKRNSKNPSRVAINKRNSRAGIATCEKIKMIFTLPISDSVKLNAIKELVGA